MLKVGDREKLGGGSGADEMVAHQDGAQPRHLSPAFLRSHKKVWVGVLIGLVLVGTATVYWINSRPLPAIDTMTEQEAIQHQIKTLDANAPAPNASPSDQEKYYNQLVLYNSQANDARGVVDALRAKEKAVPERMSYVDYYRLGTYLAQLGDKASASAAYEKSEQLLPAQDDQATGYSRASMLSDIVARKQELAQ